MKRRKIDIEHFLNGIKVDKVILMDILLLYMYSMLATISATSLVVMKTGGTRMEMLGKQFVFIIISIIIIIFICNIGKDIKLIRKASRWGFLISVCMLIPLLFKGRINIPHIIEAELSNGVYRSIKLLGVVSVQVSEVVKVCMVAYLAWAAHALKNKDVPPLIRKLCAKHPFFEKEYVQRFICLILPIIIIFPLSISTGSTNGIFILFIMLASILIGGIRTKDMIFYALIAIGLAAGGFALYKATGNETLGSIYGRLATTGEGRIYRWFTPLEEQIENARQKAKQDNKTFNLTDVLSANEDVKAQVAIKEGSFWGKGPGNSTMKYNMNNMFSDYVYAFLIEEYGILIAGIPLLLIFLSILSRGAIIARSCENLFARVIVSGYSVLLTGQGLLHMAVSVGLIPTTGQTLPLVSDGRGSLLMFSVAFGILLRISKEARKNIDRQSREMQQVWLQEQAAVNPESEDIAREGSEIMEGFDSLSSEQEEIPDGNEDALDEENEENRYE